MIAKTRLFKFFVVLLITAARLPIAVIFAVVLLAGKSNQEMYGLLLDSKFFLVSCIGLLILGELTDFLDGMLARKFKVVSEMGAMLDPYADSISRIVIYWALAVGGLVTALVPLVMAIRDITVSYSRVVIGKAGKSVSAKWSGKIKAAIQGVGSIVLLLQPYYWEWGIGKWTVQAGSWIIIVVTLASMIEYAKSAINESGGIDLEIDKS